MQGIRRRTRVWRGSRGRTGWIVAVFWSFAFLAVSAVGDSLSSKQNHADRSSATDAETPGVPDRPGASAASGTVRRIESDGRVEEVVVTGERITDLTLEERREIYRQLSQGRSLYSKNDYKRAFPLLLKTAEHGFKDAQARVGYIYLQGLGEVPRNDSTAIGWLGVAAAGNSAPEIQNYFNDMWSRVPEKYVPYLEEVVEKYESKYGEQATGVRCAMRRPAGSHLKQLSCYFERDLSFVENKMLDDFLRDSTQAPTVIGVRPEDSVVLQPTPTEAD